MASKRIIVVLGMHRSGTSALTRGLKALSVELGENLAPASPSENAKGFWEDTNISQLNRRVLAKMGGDWDTLSILDSSPLEREVFSSERQEAARLIEAKLHDISVFGFKDPRTSLLLPFWKCVFDDVGCQQSFIVALRSPLEVAASLLKRNGFDAILSYALWVKYMWAAVANTHETNRLSVSYTNLMLEPAEQLARMAAALDLNMPSPSSLPYREYIGEFLTADLRHHRISDNELLRSAQVPAIVPPFYAKLKDWADAPPGTELDLPARLKTQMEAFWTTTQPLLTLADKLKASAKAAAAKAAETEKARSDTSAALEKSKTELVERDQKIAELTRSEAENRQAREARIAALEAAEAKARQQVAEAENTLKAQAETIAGIEAAEAKARQQIAETENTLKAQADTIAAREARIAALEAAEAKARQQIAEAENTIKAQAETLAACDSQIANLMMRLEQEVSAAAESAAEAGRLNEAFKGAESGRRALEADIQQLRSRAEETARKLGAAEQKLSASIQAEARSNAQLKQVETARAQADAALKIAEAELAALRAELAERTKTTRLLRQEAHELRASTSWRVTRPLRMISTVLTRPGHVLNRLRGKPASPPPPEAS